jgi:hypothetical protein
MNSELFRNIAVVAPGCFFFLLYTDRVKHTGHFTDYGNKTIWTNEKHTGHFTDYGNQTIWTNEKQARKEGEEGPTVTWKVVSSSGGPVFF